MFQGLLLEVGILLIILGTSSCSGFAGNRIGAIRDAKGRSVASVFTGLESSQKAEVSSPRRIRLTEDSSRLGFQGFGLDGLDRT
jgi:hypothetical protein